MHGGGAQGFCGEDAAFEDAVCVWDGVGEVFPVGEGVWGD